MLLAQPKKMLSYFCHTLSIFSSILLSAFYPTFFNYCFTQLSLTTIPFQWFITFSLYFFTIFLSLFWHYCLYLLRTSLRLYFSLPLLTRLSLSMFPSHYLPIFTLVTFFLCYQKIDHPIRIPRVELLWPPPPPPRSSFYYYWILLRLIEPLSALLSFWIGLLVSPLGLILVGNHLSTFDTF